MKWTSILLAVMAVLAMFLRVEAAPKPAPAPLKIPVDKIVDRGFPLIKGISAGIAAHGILKSIKDRAG